MSEDSTPALGGELLDDFFAECDEHFRTLRARLGSLDPDRPQEEALEAIYRGVHSLKGNAGIVGLAPLERLAHAIEDVIRMLIRGRRAPDSDAAALLRAASERMERIVAAFRLHQPLPAVADLVERLKLEGTSASAPGVWVARFTPGPERDARGVNVSTVRARLAAAGEILKGEPVVLPGGGMVFAFTVRLAAPPAELPAWTADGVAWEEAPASKSAEAVAPAESATSLTPAAPSHLVRVDLSRLDDLMRLVGEMLIQRSRLGDRLGRLGDASPGIQEAMSGLGRLLRDMRGAITRMRLVPIAEIFSRLPFAVRDLERTGEKRVRVEVEGEHTEIDKYLVERLREPLLHLVRNAVSHGIETTHERRAAGKPEEAVLTLRASARGDFALIEVGDDGRGVDTEAVTRRAAAAGVALSPSADAAQLLDVLCLPGFSTRHEADRESGRGVGLDVVASVVRELGGSLALETAAGRGTKFILRLPLTLSIAETFIVSAGTNLCAVPQGYVEEIVQVPAASTRQVEGVAVAPYRSGLLPLISLPTLFGVAAPAPDSSPVLVLATDRGLTGLVVDRVHGHREVVVRPLRDPLIRVPGISAATELGDGKPVLILDPPALVTGPVRPRQSPLAA